MQGFLLARPLPQQAVRDYINGASAAVEPLLTVS
jgi:hypothetical protein